MLRTVGLIVEVDGELRPSEGYYRSIGVNDFLKIKSSNKDWLAESSFTLPINFYLSDLSLVQGVGEAFSKFLEVVKQSNSNLHLIKQNISTQETKGKVLLDILISVGKNENLIKNKFRKH